MFINWDFIQKQCILTKKLLQAISIFNVDRIQNKNGSVTQYMSLIIRYKNYSEKMYFYIVDISKADMIIRYNLLKKHNSDIDWEIRNIELNWWS